MGHRAIKRVPLDFTWPIDEIWEGYLNPYWSQAENCASCDGTGSSPLAKYFSDQWYGNAPFHPFDTGSVPFTVTTPAVRAFAERQCQRAPEFYGYGEGAIVREAERVIKIWNRSWMNHLSQEDVDALVEVGRLLSFTHNFVEGKGWVAIEPRPVVTPQMVNDWNILSLGHDSINQWVCVKARCAREGVETSCPDCNGEGTIWPSPEVKAQYENWEPTEPPVGDGWQLWETVSEGSPVSPVFDSAEGLADYCVVNEDLMGDKLSRRQWLQLITGEEDIDAGSMMVIVNGGAQAGFIGSVAALTEVERNSKE